MCQLAASSYKKRLYLLKEERFFYTPLAQSTDCLPDEETAHAVRVLRLGVGDPIRLMDGKGCFYQAEIVEATKKICRYKILNGNLFCMLPWHRQKIWIGLNGL